MITDLKDKPTTIETTVQRKSTTPITAANEDIFTSDFLNMHHTSTGLSVEQTASNISEWKTSKWFSLSLL